MHLQLKLVRHTVKCKANVAIYHIGQGLTIEHAHVVYVPESPDLGASHARCHRLVPHIHRVVQPWDGLGCYAHCERVHLRAQADELDDRIALCFILEIADFFGVYSGSNTSEIG